MLYSEKVMDHFANPRNVGELENPDGVGEVGNAKCGDIMKMFLKIEDGKIADVRFKTFGCGAAIATSSMATEMVKGKTVQEATKALEGQSVSFKNELLFSKGINFDQLPSWQKRGIGVWKEQYEKEGHNPVTGKCETAVRSRLKVEYELPLGEAYAKQICSFL